MGMATLPRLVVGCVWRRPLLLGSSSWCFCEAVGVENVQPNVTNRSATASGLVTWRRSCSLEPQTDVHCERTQQDMHWRDKHEGVPARELNKRLNVRKECLSQGACLYRN